MVQMEKAKLLKGLGEEQKAPGISWPLMLGVLLIGGFFVWESQKKESR